MLAALNSSELSATLHLPERAMTKRHAAHTGDADLITDAAANITTLAGAARAAAILAGTADDRGAVAFVIS